MDDFYMPGLSHFENNNGWSGSRGLLCYEIEPPADGSLNVVVWYGPFCREYAEIDTSQPFPLTTEGVAQMKQWLLDRAVEMNTHPTRTPEACRAYYEERKHGTQKGEHLS